MLRSPARRRVVRLLSRQNGASLRAANRRGDQRSTTVDVVEASDNLCVIVVTMVRIARRILWARQSVKALSLSNHTTGMEQYVSSFRPRETQGFIFLDVGKTRGRARGESPVFWNWASWLIRPTPDGPNPSPLWSPFVRAEYTLDVRGLDPGHDSLADVLVTTYEGPRAPCRTTTTPIASTSGMAYTHACTRGSRSSRLCPSEGPLRVSPLRVLRMYNLTTRRFSVRHGHGHGKLAPVGALVLYDSPAFVLPPPSPRGCIEAAILYDNARSLGQVPYNPR
ncbi:hypothetical protein HD554DRAFT_2042402 [Boletus coccyginus]|nr:hypothetical protein HD554DRAFT_2042402 [Boletus coccyginus]